MRCRNVGSVAGAGASIAHALHEAGIGVVLAAQFPLSFEGSVRFVEVLYRICCGAKTRRQVIYDLRRRLFSQIPTRHDWASLTAYLVAAQRFREAAFEVKIKMALESINAAMSYADEITSQASTLIQSAQAPNIDAGMVIERMKDATKRLNDLVKEIPTERDEIYGLLASTEKRQAEVWFRGKDFWQDKGILDYAEKSSKLLLAARDHYWDSFQANRGSHWAVTQYLSLAAVLARIQGKPGKESAKPVSRGTRTRLTKEFDVTEARPEKSLPGLWALVRMHSLYDLNHENIKTRSWAHGNLLSSTFCRCCRNSAWIVARSTPNGWRSSMPTG